MMQKVIGTGRMTLSRTSKTRPHHGSMPIFIAKKVISGMLTIGIEEQTKQGQRFH